jgi:hypothetical protein
LGKLHAVAAVHMRRICCPGSDEKLSFEYKRDSASKGDDAPAESDCNSGRGDRRCEDDAAQ